MSVEQHDRGHILVVDDEEPVARMLQQWLEREGYAVQWAADLSTLLRLMAEGSFDLLSLDVRMPGVDGLEVLDWLARIHPEVGAVMATAVGDLNAVIEAMRKGAIGYLLKPFDMELVSQEIGRAMEHQRLIAENRARRLELERRVAERTRQLRQVQARLERQVRELEARDRLVRLQMDPPAETRQAFAEIAEVVVRATGAGEVILWHPDKSGAHLERAAASRPRDLREGAAEIRAGEEARLSLQEAGRLPVQVFRCRQPLVGSPGEAAVPVLYSEDPLAVLQVIGLPEGDDRLDLLWRLGREAALLLRMVQVARDLEREEPAIDALLRTGGQRWPES